MITFKMHDFKSLELILIHFTTETLQHKRQSTPAPPCTKSIFKQRRQTVYVTLQNSPLKILC